MTVLICTRNRAKSLDRTLGTITRAKHPKDGDWELIVVDNGSTDETQQVIESYRTKLPIRTVIETASGLSHARNRGVAEASGDFIIWTDDDVGVNETWMDAYLKAIEANPKAAVLGGKIFPDLDEPETDWFRRNLDLLGELAAYRDFGDKPLLFDPANGIEPFGANFAVRTEEQRQCLYDPNRGLVPGNERRGEEVDVVARILSQGHEGVWVPESSVQHYITRQRQTVDYVKAYYSSQGQSLGLDEYNRSTPTVFGAPLSIWAKAAIYNACRLVMRPFNEKLWVRSLIGSSVQNARLKVWRAGGTVPSQ
ncbi:MAG: glycosyltransferase family 2 protein [Xanthobacteraceae bacterium]|nr:glycosyltransferase family 2 protein [Xanthobacteraceae bacterium]